MRRIKELPERLKPREKLHTRGAEALSDEELTAILLGSGIRGREVHAIARDLVTLIRKEPYPQPKQLHAIRGLGVAKSAQIAAALELGRRLYASEPERPRITCAEELYTLLRPFARKNREHFLSVTLDGASRVIRTRTVFIGTLNQSLVHPREVFADAIEDRAAGIIVAHNHPSGTLEASHADIQVTRRLKEVSGIVGIELLDHLILSPSGFCSFSQEGLPPFG